MHLQKSRQRQARERQKDVAISLGLKAARKGRFWILSRGRFDDFQLARDVTATLITKLGLVGLGLISNVLIARALGPEGRGVYVVALTLGAIGVQFGNLGLHASNTYHVARDRRRLPVLFGNSIVVCVFAGLLTAMCAGSIAWLAPSVVPVHGPLLVLAVGWVPIGLAYLLLQSLLVGVGAIRAFNVIELVAPSTAIVLFAVTVVLQISTPEVFFAIMVGSQSIGLLLIWRTLSRGRSLSVSPSLAVFRELFRYGVKAYVAALFAFLVLRSDLLLVSYLLGTEQIGQYSVAVLVADTLGLVPVAAGTIVFPRLSALSAAAEKWRLAARVSIAVGLVTIMAAFLTGVFAQSLVQVFFGERFLPAVPAILWLLPGIVPLAINTIYMNYFASNGMPLVIIVSPALAALLNVLMNLVLIPRYGIVGASVSSSIAYSLMLVCSLLYIWRRRVQR